jgi:hypothetical protein
VLLRLIVFKIVFAFLVIGSALGLAIRDGVQASLQAGSDNPTAAVRMFRQYPLPLGCGCAAVAFLASFGDLLLAGRRKGALPTYTDEEFVAKFGGTTDAQRLSQSHQETCGD